VVQGLKCPCCGTASDHLSYRSVEARGPDGGVVSTLVLGCPGCDMMLGASVNPSEYVAAMLRQMSRGHAAAESNEPAAPRVMNGARGAAPANQP
jgi:hypothetical protein